MMDLPQAFPPTDWPTTWLTQHVCSTLSKNACGKLEKRPK